MNNEELQYLVSRISLDSFQKPFMHRAYFNSRLRSTGGRYLLHSHNIEVNPKAYELYGISEVEGIVRHELCHYHLHLEGKGYQHRDKDFRELLGKVNAPRFCAVLQMPKTASKKQRRLYTYTCVKCQQSYVRKIRMNVEKYCCSKCLGRLKLME
ncbi:SprT family protein [Lysinibacillus sp. KCTC 33748]|uniref:SprT family protein n=1 Tax=unclassified Lysinibacillus TaxID=2636778 RepID=UPI0009A7D6B3|nr:MULTISPECIES: SprT family protein [unclassified Lysinibacillus]OXS72366.1 SprT family protein [Lysinibacillus sp. KCTC 33748]SKB96954.1 SprT-like protein [Lysinibacillus sp. AC-3]